MRNKFDRDLQKLHDDVVQMSTFIETTIDKTMSAFRTNDYALAREVCENDDIADELELKVERRSLRILLSQQPVARDLRTISTALKMISDMERICDQAKNIAGIILRFEGHELIKKPDTILLLSEKCVHMVNKSVEAFMNNDLELARTVMTMDDEVDAIYHNIHDNVTELVTQNPDNVMQAVDFVMMAKFLERIADHAVNIAEWVEFNITGEHKNKILL
ncbi:MAG: phosphate signaling complex protein PhoU [Chitinispirillia bacterium]|nr:phosphate signaling complex protein PhoU [Chitinispirillia bacterium]MCL2268854.1 phosphate signaling complex protein PhoU [Chitinispirillia bacterium]